MSGKILFKMLFCLMIILANHVQIGFTQTKVQIIKANSLKGKNTALGAVRVLKGNVHIQIDDNNLYCDSALHFVDINEIRAYSKVFISGEDEKVWADSAYYNSKSDISNFYGNVAIERDTTLLFSTKISYSYPLKTAYFTEPFQLEDNKGILKANRGIYFTELDSASFRGGVQLADSVFYIEADSVLSNRKSEQYELFGDVFAHHYKENSFIRSQYMFIDSTGYRKLRDESLLVKIDSAKADTIIIQAKNIDYYEHKDSTYSFDAIDSVKIWSNDFSSFSDTADYESKTELFTLLSNAFAWNKKLQLSSEHIFVQLLDDTVRSIRAYPIPFAVQPDSISGRFQQMRGDTVFAEFFDGKLSQVTFAPNAAVAFFSNNEEDKPDGLMIVHSEKVILFFENDELVDMKATKDIKSTFSEETVGIEDYRLTGFVWKPELRPEKQAVPSSEKEIPIKKPFWEYPKHHPDYKKSEFLRLDQ